MKTPKEIAQENNLPLVPAREKQREVIYPLPRKQEPNPMQELLKHGKAKDVCGVCGKIRYENDFMKLESPCENVLCPFEDSPINKTDIYF